MSDRVQTFTGQTLANNCDIYVDSELSNKWLDPQMIEILRAKNYNPTLNVYTTAGRDRAPTNAQ